MNAPRIILGSVLAAAMTAGIVGLSQIPWQAESGSHARLRLAWRYRSALVTACRTRSAEELERLPQHMRRAQDCERRLRPYRLDILLDSAVLASDTVAARGARADRPLSVYLELPVEPGRHALRIAFSPLEHDSTAPPGFLLDTTLTLAQRQVLLVTLDDGATRFVTTTR